jgi:gliding motility-associated-like protein
MTRFCKYLVCFMFLVIFTQETFGTHIRAADISASLISGRTFRIKLSVYTDFDNVIDNPNNPKGLDVGSFDIGFGNQNNPLEVRTVNRLGDPVEIVKGVTFENIYETIYTLPSAGSGVVVYFSGNARNGGINNISGSDQFNIYVETFIYVDPFLGPSNTPRLTVPPIDQAVIGQPFTHNPGAFDLEGDSLSFELVNPKTNSLTTVGGYFLPQGLTINPKTGQILWDSPDKRGEYNIAYRVNEFRNGVRTNFVVRDMQINVVESPNIVPTLVMPIDTCIAVGTNYQASVFANDPNGNVIGMTLEAGIKELGGTLTIFKPSASQINGLVKWTPGCNAVSKLPIQGVIRVNDNHPQPLTAVNSWSVQVVATAPKLTSAVPLQNQIKLTWDKYNCILGRSSIQIFRTTCDTSNIKRSQCVTGVDPAWGFLQIGETTIDATEFIDNGLVGGITSGVTYYYIIVAKFGSPFFSESYASNVLFSSLNAELPLLTKVSFDKQKNDQFLSVSWAHFAEIDTLVHPGPYVYQIKNKGNLIATQTTAKIESANLSIDTNLIDLTKSLDLTLIDGNKQTWGNLSLAFAEKLVAKGSDKALDITWTNRSGWWYSDTLQQRIFAFKKGRDTLLVDSVKGGVTNYSIKNLRNGDTVCAFVALSYRYCIDGLDSTFESFTNTSCALIRDNIAPCPPVVSLVAIDCVNKPIGNKLSWTNPSLSACQKDIKGYKVYRQDLIEKGEFNLIKTVEGGDSSYYDTNGVELNCYYITAFDTVLNESQKSNKVCQDFCGEIRLPNIITPNGDGLNEEVVSPLAFTGFTEVQFLVFNRWGKEVYKETDFETLKWNGISSDGQPLSDGTYFIYVSGVRKTGDKKKTEYKGWLQITR